jgi:hypothetical protein
MSFNKKTPETHFLHWKTKEKMRSELGNRQSQEKLRVAHQKTSDSLRAYHENKTKK